MYAFYGNCCVYLGVYIVMGNCLYVYIYLLLLLLLIDV